MRRIPVFICATFAVLTALFSPANVFASSGSTTIAMWRSTSNSSYDGIESVIWVSNVSKVDIEITLRLRDQAGVWLGQTGFLPNLQSIGFSSCSSTGVCTLAAGKSGYFHVSVTNPAGGSAYGYGKLEWVATGADVEQVAIVASGYLNFIKSATDISRLNMVITRDQPF
jgi:hypothetical protein